MRGTVHAAVAAVLALALVAAPASAESFAGTGEFEIYAGWFWPDEEADSSLDDLTYGLRLGYNATSHFGIVGTIGYWESDEETATAFFESEALFGDLSFEWLVNPQSNAVFVVYGGPGVVSREATVLTKAGGAMFVADDEELSLHFGLSARISAGERFFVRPDVRVRWFDNTSGFTTSNEDLTWEASIGLGWYIGAP